MVPVDLLNYHLIRMLGSGGMGEVYLARNKNIEQYVAVKALHPRYGNNPMLRAKFKQEAVMLNSLNHPNIVKFYNFVENEYGVFLIMEYVEGDTLEDFISKKIDCTREGLSHVCRDTKCLCLRPPTWYYPP